MHLAFRPAALTAPQPLCYHCPGSSSVSVSEQDIPGIALIGCGGMAAHYRDSYTSIPGTAYRLVVDADAALARSVAKQLAVPRSSADWRDALAPDIRIADISTPNHLHAEQATALLAAGKHVLLQKPMAPTVPECTQIVEAARASRVTAGVYMSDLEDPLVWDLREMVRGGHLGAISSVRGRYAHRGGLRAQPAVTNWRGSAEKTGGGSFIQLSLHHTNLLSWILGERIASVMAYSANRMCPNIGGDDTTAAVCEFAGGAPGVFESAWNADGTLLEIFGSEGRVRVFGGQGSAAEVVVGRPFTTGRVVRAEEPGKVVRVPACGDLRAHCRRDNPLNQHVAFVEAVLAGREPQVTAETGRYDVAVAKAVYASAEQGRRIAITEMLA
uniref:Gfo/Idh/MocA family oxidoreductase n=1 Tax=uncultured Armatimonadetes bacterium TaxID=157466 RepID=A0A6J4HZT4_9BACT|nr:hypothetical protein AVDCRST_MAG63-1310 [uncultured Armatimonadetes bacterium]